MPSRSYAPLLEAFDAGHEAGAVGATVSTEVELAEALADAAVAQQEGRATMIEVMISGTQLPTGWSVMTPTSGSATSTTRPPDSLDRRREAR